jgi:hypothetical protein
MRAMSHAERERWLESLLRRQHAPQLERLQCRIFDEIESGT